jgi:hypothetical protein
VNVNSPLTFIWLFDSEDAAHVWDAAFGVGGGRDAVACASELVDAEAQRRAIRVCDGCDFNEDSCELRCIGGGVQGVGFDR